MLKTAPTGGFCFSQTMDKDNRIWYYIATYLKKVTPFFNLALQTSPFEETTFCSFPKKEQKEEFTSLRPLEQLLRVSESQDKPEIKNELATALDC